MGQHKRNKNAELAKSGQLPPKGNASANVSRFLAEVFWRAELPGHPGEVWPPGSPPLDLSWELNPAWPGAVRWMIRGENVSADVMFRMWGEEGLQPLSAPDAELASRKLMNLVLQTIGRDLHRLHPELLKLRNVFAPLLARVPGFVPMYDPTDLTTVGLWPTPAA